MTGWKIIALLALPSLSWGAACVFDSAHRGSGAAGDQTCNLTWAGYTRQIILHIPTAVANGSGLVLVYHGVPDTSANFQSTTQLNVESDAAGFVLVFPVGWVYNTTERWQNYGGERDRAQNNAPLVDDVGFSRYIVQQVQSGMAAGNFGGSGIVLASTRTYAMGFSAGGTMANRVEIEAGDVFSAVISANIQFGPSPPNNTSPLFVPNQVSNKNISLNTWLGDADATTAYCGDGQGNYADSVYNFSTTTLHNSYTTGIPSTGSLCTSNGGSITSVEELTSTGTFGTSRFCRIIGGDHQWLGQSIATTTCASPMNNSENANQIMWDWFNAHPYVSTVTLTTSVYPITPIVNQGTNYLRLGCKINGAYSSSVTWSIQNTGGCGLATAGSSSGSITSDGFFVAPSSVPAAYGFDYCTTVCTSNADATQFVYDWVSISNPSNFNAPSLSGTLATPVIGVPYTGTVSETGLAAPASWNVDGSLPPGLTGCNGTTGSSCTISGTPTTSGPSMFTIVAVDSSTIRNVTQYFSLNTQNGMKGAGVYGTSKFSGSAVIQ